MKMVSIDVSGLSGRALDWAVGVSVMGKPTLTPHAWVFLGGEGREWYVTRDSNKGRLKRRALFSPSSEWWQGGPLIDKYEVEFQIDIENAGTDEEPVFAELRRSLYSFGRIGANHLIAAMRAIVDYHLHDVVEVPEELVDSLAGRDLYSTPIGALELKEATENHLVAGGITSIGELIERKPGHLLALPGLGKKSLQDIEGALDRYGGHRLL